MNIQEAKTNIGKTVLVRQNGCIWEASIEGTDPSGKAVKMDGG